MKKSYIFECKRARRIPDPNFKTTYNAEKHIFMMRCRDMPDGIGHDPNARSPNIKRLIYRNIGKSLLGEDTDAGTFHLKNKGITIIAESVKQAGDNCYEVVMESGIHGIVDGGHTYTLICEHIADVPEDQYVQVEVRTGIPQDWIAEIAGGLNTSVQVKEMSLENLRSAFAWLKVLLGEKQKLIAWEENEDGILSITDIISLMYLFNISLYPSDKNTHPTAAYVSQQKTLKSYQDSRATFEAMQPIVLDILRLADIIAATAPSVWNRKPLSVGGILENDDADVDESEQNGKTRGAGLKIIEGKGKKARNLFEFPFSGHHDSRHRLCKPALYPILGAFRHFVHRDKVSGEVSWHIEFSQMEKFWYDNGRELLEIAQRSCKELKSNLNALGKSNNYWDTVHARVGFKAMHEKLIKP